jgi:hypothetical protein
MEANDQAQQHPEQNARLRAQDASKPTCQRNGAAPGVRTPKARTFARRQPGVGGQEEQERRAQRQDQSVPPIHQRGHTPERHARHIHSRTVVDAEDPGAILLIDRLVGRQGGQLLGLQVPAAAAHEDVADAGGAQRL